MRRVNKPNFFIVGAPKCGTTALYSYLASHPEVGMSRNKEPGFFAPDILGHQRNSTTIGQYLKNFEHATGKRRIGEASPMYLASRTAPREILALDRSTQIVVMLRNPVDVLHALHTARVFSEREHITHFELAVDSSETRYWKSGEFRGEPILNLSYREATRFSEQVERYFEAFGRKQVHVVLFDDLAARPQIEYEKVLAFLGLPSDGRREFGIINGNKRLRSRIVQKHLRNLSGVLQFYRSFPAFQQGLRSIAARLNVVGEPRPPMDPQFRQRLEMEYAPEVDHLGRLLGRNLDHWVNPASQVKIFLKSAGTAAL